MIDVLLEFTHKAGNKLKSLCKRVENIGNKTDSVESLVTQADVYVSDFFEKTIKKHFSHLNYMIIDEEKMDRYGNDIFDAVKNTEYQFVIDPIDGTLQYASGHKLYGISVGVYKNGKPLMGVVYMPELNEMVYFDGKKAYWVQNSFKKNEIKTELLPNTKSNSPIIFGHLWLWNMKSEFSLRKAVLVDYYSAVSQSFYPLIGKAKAYVMKLKLWDIAGAIPIAKYLGMKIYEYGSMKTYDEISPEFFDKDMSTRKHCVLCYPEDYKEICSLIEPRF